MVKINLRIVEDKIKTVEMTGHANSGPYGQDLVCAAFTGIINGALNAFDLYQNKDVKITISDNKILVDILNIGNEELQIMLKMLKVQLHTIVVQYPKLSQIREDK